jgi:DNA-binding PadR family transcriptional regulator
MSIRQSLLAILNQGPCYGYQLRAEFERRTGSTWPLNVGQIYNTLDRLERDGLVRKADTDKDGHVYYAITGAGTAEVDHWLGTSLTRTGVARDELAIKLAIAVTLPGTDIAEVIRAQRAASMTRLQALTTAKSASNDPRSAEELAEMLIVDSMIFAAEAEVRWLDHAKSQLTRASDAGELRAVPLNTQAPKRGRPARPPLAAPD